MRKIITWLYPTIIILLAIAASLVTFVFPGTIVRPFVLIAFLFFCPGVAVVRFFRLNYMIIEWLLAFTLSVAIDALVAGILLYAGLWSPIHIFIILLGLCLLSAIIQFILSLRARLHPHPSSLSSTEISKAREEATISLTEVVANVRKATPTPAEISVSNQSSTKVTADAEEATPFPTEVVADARKTTSTPTKVAANAEEATSSPAEIAVDV